MKKVLIVEDHDDIQLMYSLLVRRIGGITIVSQVASGEEAMVDIQGKNPDLAIVDISLPGIDGLDLTRELRRLYPNLKILVATGHDAEYYSVKAQEAGADGFIVKGDTKMMMDKIRELLKL